MPSFYTRTGDDGFTGLLGEGRVPKYDLRPEVLGTLDEATAAIGIARASCQLPGISPLLLKIQRDLYGLMAEAAATETAAKQFHTIDEAQVIWIEEQIQFIGTQVRMPRDFILPGDTQGGAVLDLARTIVRRAERRMAELLHRGDVSNPELLRYLNRLSSLLFVLEIAETQVSGKDQPTLAKEG